MGQRLCALAVLSEDLGLLPRTHMAAHNCPQSQFPLFHLTSIHQACTWCTCIHTGKTLMRIKLKIDESLKINFKKLLKIE